MTHQIKKEDEEEEDIHSFMLNILDTNMETQENDDLTELEDGFSGSSTSEVINKRRLCQNEDNELAGRNPAQKLRRLHMSSCTRNDHNTHHTDENLARQNTNNTHTQHNTRRQRRLFQPHEVGITLFYKF